MSFKRLDEFSRVPGWQACCDQTTWVYALTDPRDHTVRYVGVSINPHKRLNFHCQKAVNWKVREWLDQLRPAKPGVTLLAEVCKCNWDRAEISWIGFFLNSGELYNIHKGGRQKGNRGAPKFANSAFVWPKPKRTTKRLSKKQRRKLKRLRKAQRKQDNIRRHAEIMRLPECSPEPLYDEFIAALDRAV